ncbi:sigma 54-interacting transcriptional regulator, partial [Pseudomonas sp. TNT11]
SAGRQHYLTAISKVDDQLVEIIDVRNLMLSPSAGIDPQMLFDTRPLADQILATLQTHARFHELSAKFAVQLDGFEALAMLEHHHDLWLSAFEQHGETLLAFGLAGCPGLDAPLAAVRLEQGHALVVAVLERFLDLATPAQTRMRHLPVDNFFDGLHLPLLPVDGFKRPASGALLHLGSYPQRQQDRVYVAAVTPLGRLDSSMLKGAAQLANEYGDGTLRFTPWQGLLLPNAKHHDLEKMVAEGTFREDLFYRLNVLNVEVPPLRERGQDILLLARYFMQQACAQIQRPVCRLAPGTYPALLGNRWPGNVRQLQNVIFRAAAICESSLVDIGDLDIAGTSVARQSDSEIDSLEQAVEDFERSLLEKLYTSYPSTRQLASRLHTSHTAIAHRLRKYGIPNKP